MAIFSTLLFFHLLVFSVAKPTPKPAENGKARPYLFGLRNSEMDLPTNEFRRYDPWGGKRSMIQSNLKETTEDSKGQIVLNIGSINLYYKV